ncbi:hypothetical protein R1sor_014141 [Riccia sorocarpa]|uniref:DDE-1 domain-containing protein n=1 Tax=Riccia sorocarpa TaxID=122646 RepID=A0ABD3HB62_9MARC
MLENVDETHFINIMDNGDTLGFQGDQEVKYEDVVSGGQGMMMIVRLTGGRDPRIETPMIIFQNKDRRYPMRGVPDYIPGVCYRTRPKGWDDTLSFPQWCQENPVITRDHDDRTRIIYMDNCSCHNETPKLTVALQDINAIICLGKLLNPGKTFFLKLAASSVRKVNVMRDKQGVLYTRKAMIRCGLAKNVNGVWEVGQLSPELQEIIRKHKSQFDGIPVPKFSVDSSVQDSQILLDEDNVL